MEKRFIRDSEIHSLEDYFSHIDREYEIEKWFCTRLIPFDLIGDEFHWISIPITLKPGKYRLCLTIDYGGRRYPITAYGLIYPETMKKLPHPFFYPSGMALSFTPICVTNNSFMFAKNTSDFVLRFGGDFKICVTTSNWTDHVKKTTCEFLLLREKEDQEIE